MAVIKLIIGITAITAWMVFALSPGGPTADGPASLDHAGLPTQELAGETLAEAETFALPTKVSVVAERLVVVDRYAEQPITWLDRTTGSVIGYFGLRGEGPGEFAAATSIVKDPADSSTLWVYDFGLARLTPIDPNGSDLLGRPEFPTLTLRTPAPTLDVAWLPDGSLIATGFFSEGRLARFDRQGDLIGMVGSIPPTSVSAPPAVRQHAFHSVMALSPDYKRVVLASRYAGLVEIYETHSWSQLSADSPFPFDPRFEVAESSHGPVMAGSPHTRLGYVDVAVTAERIYALFSGRTPAGYQNRASFGEYVHVFDWSGKFLNALKLDAEVIAIALDETASTLYAVRHLPVPAVLRYELANDASGRTDVQLG